MRENGFQLKGKREGGGEETGEDGGISSSSLLNSQ